MILLPHGCTCSELAVNPKNWKTGPKSLIKKNWRIHYYFRDPAHKDKYPYGKLITIKGMNRFKTIEERREATKILIEEEIYQLKVKGYNPITKQYNGQDIILNYDISPETTLNEAIDLAFSKIEAEKSTISDLKTVVKYFKKSAAELRYHLIKIGEIKHIHIKNILDHQRRKNNYSNARFNKIRAYMLMIFKQLLLSDAINHNHILDIPKLKETRKIRDILTEDEFNKIKKHLKKTITHSIDM